MTVEIKVADKEELKRWDEIVDDSSMATIFHKLDWLKITEKYTRSKLYPLIGYRGQEIIGIFPVFYQKKYFIKTIFSPPSKTGIPNLGPITLNNDNKNQYQKEQTLKEFIFESNKFLEGNINPDFYLITCSAGLLDCRPFIWLGYNITPLYTYYLDLGCEINKIWDNLKKEVRTDIKYAEKNGIKIELQNSESTLNAVYDICKARYEEQNKNYPILKEYLVDLFNKQKKYFNIFVAKEEGKIINGLILLNFKNKVIHLMGTAKVDVRGCTDLLLWESIRWSINNKYKIFELMGANTERLCKFKSKYNPELVPYFLVEKSNFFGKLGKKVYIVMKGR